MIIALCGFVGAGKTTVANIINDNYEKVNVVSTGDIVRKMLLEKNLEKTPENLQKINETILADRGDDYISIIFDSIIPSLKFNVIDCLRRPEDVVCLVRNYSNVEILAVVSSQKKRFDRLISRGRMADYNSLEKFKEISLLEEEWGVQKVIDTATKSIANEGTLELLQDYTMSIVKDFERF